ncbi:uncharacterized protein LOC142566275 [Dermacentor variabilis]|uniref:uncharacterized protein LOC142566275 n=1 Tax=Dermacentor variabilis TaxID=34621 RepID=UPI003F5C6E64
MEDLTEDGGVMNKITQPGSGPAVTRHALVMFHYNAYVKCSWTERIDSTWMRNTPHRCNLKELGVLGLHIASLYRACDGAKDVTSRSRRLAVALYGAGCLVVPSSWSVEMVFPKSCTVLRLILEYEKDVPEDEFLSS